MTTIQSTYRVQAFHEEDGVMLLRDKEREEPVVVRANDYPPALQEKVDNLRVGNLIGAYVEGEADGDGVWEYRSVDVLSRETHHLFGNAAEAPGPHGQVWEGRRSEDAVGVEIFTDDKSGRELVEMQVAPSQTDGHRVIDLLTDGRLPMEEWYHDLQQFDTGAQHIIVADVADAPYLVFYCFPYHDERSLELHKEFYEQVAGLQPA